MVPDYSSSTSKRRTGSVAGLPDPTALDEVHFEESDRIVTDSDELNRVMGGGITRGSITLVAGEPGIGKSTLLTQLPRTLGSSSVLYVSGEESVRQVGARANRLGVPGDRMHVLAETNVETIEAVVRSFDADVLVVDSVQTLYHPAIPSAPGSVVQVRECSARLMQLAKQNELATFVVGHVTKDGSIAGPRVLEHLVDTVLYFEGDRHHTYRLLRAVKNRFGSTNEMGVFAMDESGLTDVSNPSELFLANRRSGIPGSVVICTIEGTRPFLAEVQALVADRTYGAPQRMSTGFDTRRLQMLLAVLEKREGLALSDRDVFVNVAGGIRLDEPAADLGVAAAIVSSWRGKPVDDGTVFIGEIGLGGELRPVSRMNQRLTESKRLGFSSAVIPERSKPSMGDSGLKIVSGELFADVI